VNLFYVVTDRDLVTAYLAQLGLWAPVLSLLIVSLQHMTPVFPGQAVILAASGYLYGPAGGFFINMLAAVAASQLAFVLARRAGKPFVNRILPAKLLDRWQEVADKRGFYFLVMNFWFPVIPGNAANYLAGLTSISFWTFLLANILGRIPGVLIITLIGAYGFNLSWAEVWSHLPHTVNALFMWIL
ncbi:MAG TPA: VTT domain-containing protein, partial [Anaerolineae bacterium]|nr:VTT domain-containing protein [Anaerolineae bacterium]